jgi:hypothetical protein
MALNFQIQRAPRAKAAPRALEGKNRLNGAEYTKITHNKSLPKVAPLLRKAQKGQKGCEFTNNAF